MWEHIFCFLIFYSKCCYTNIDFADDISFEFQISKYPSAAQSFMKKHPNSKMIEGMEALRSIAATSMFLQNEKTNTNSSENASNHPLDYYSK